MRLSSNEVESRNHCTQLTVKPPSLTLSSGSVPAILFSLNLEIVVNVLNEGEGKNKHYLGKMRWKANKKYFYLLKKIL